MRIASRRIGWSTFDWVESLEAFLSVLRRRWKMEHLFYITVSHQRKRKNERKKEKKKEKKEGRNKERIERKKEGRNNKGTEQ